MTSEVEKRIRPNESSERRQWRRLLIAAGLSTGLVACGGSSSDDVTTGPPAGIPSPSPSPAPSPAPSPSPSPPPSPPPAPPPLKVATARLAAGTGYSLALRADGRVLGWGSQMAGGAGPAVAGTAAHLVDGINGVAAVAATRVAPPFNSSFALAANGSVFAWGNGFAAAPGLVAEAGPVAQIVSCFDGPHYALRSDGTVWRFSATGATAIAGLSGVQRIDAAHRSNACAISAVDNAGALRLVDGSTVQTVPGLPAVTQAICNFDPAGLARYCLAVSTTGRIWSWGSNSAGQLGDGSTTGRTLPAELPAPVGVAALGAVVGTSFALTTDGRVFSWGGGIGNLGWLGRDVTALTYQTPGAIAGLPAVAELAFGSHVLARGTDGSVWSWGSNVWGEGGTGTAGDNAFYPRAALGVRLD